MIAKTQKIWILLHEFAHWRLGHRQMRGMGSHRQEYQADMQALVWLLRSEHNHGALEGMVPSATAIPTLFDILRCAERLYPQQHHTHPSFEERWNKIAGLDEVQEKWKHTAFDQQIFCYLSTEMEHRHG